jgi:hypothetical protein
MLIIIKLVKNLLRKLFFFPNKTNIEPNKGINVNAEGCVILLLKKTKEKIIINNPVD